MSYTEGPRTVYKPILGFTDYWVVESDHGNLYVAIIESDDPEADAHLIAAAPKLKHQRDDLLAACEWLVNLACGVGKAGGDPAPTEFADAVDAGKAAIAKVKGEGADG